MHLLKHSNNAVKLDAAGDTCAGIGADTAVPALVAGRRSSLVRLRSTEVPPQRIICPCNLVLIPTLLLPIILLPIIASRSNGTMITCVA